MASFKTLLGTLALSLLISIVLSPRLVGNWMFQNPETLGLVFSAQLLLGRYTGYRLTELYRFGDFVRENGGPGDSSQPDPSPLGKGKP